MLRETSPLPPGVPLAPSLENELRRDRAGERVSTSAKDTRLSIVGVTAPELASVPVPVFVPVPVLRPYDDCLDNGGRSTRGESDSANMIRGPAPSSLVMVVCGTRLLENRGAEELWRDKGGRSGLRIPRGSWDEADPLRLRGPGSRIPASLGVAGVVGVVVVRLLLSAMVLAMVP